MKQQLMTCRSAFLTALLAGLTMSISSADETTSYKHVVKVQAEGSEVIEADVSDLQPGEAMSFTTESGRLIDILQGVDGLEIYLDGELIANPGTAEGQVANAAILHERLIACEQASGGDCEGLHGQLQHKKIEIHCVSDDDAECENISWVGADHEIEVLGHGGQSEENVIVIRKRHHEKSLD